MNSILNIACPLCVIYICFMWAAFVLDNLIFLFLQLLKKEQKPGSMYAFTDAFMQRGKEGEVPMAIINVVAHIGFVIWIIQLFQ